MYIIKRKTTILLIVILQWLILRILNVNICESKQRSMYILMDDVQQC